MQISSHKQVGEYQHVNYHFTAKNEGVAKQKQNVRKYGYEFLKIKKIQ